MNGKFDLQNKDDKFSGIFLSTLVVGTKVCGWQTLDIPSPYTFALLENGKVDFYCDYMIWFQFQFQFGLSLFFYCCYSCRFDFDFGFYSWLFSIKSNQVW